ncbi:MAG: hypothetical protein E7004_06005 [Alphaproteobacteria bacterium]|nr:hypothetical protein [Alphaproteobacteria bacterium]
MVAVIKKISILHRLKNIVTKTRRMLSWRAKIKDEHVNAFDARDIQQDIYNHTKNIKHNTYTPPYIELAAQLLVNEQQIFEAAATKLTTIAKSRKKYANEIKSIFTEVIAGRKLSEEKINYLNAKIDEI